MIDLPNIDCVIMDGRTVFRVIDDSDINANSSLGSSFNEPRKLICEDMLPKKC